MRTYKSYGIRGTQRSTAKLIRKFAIRGATGFIGLLIVEYIVFPELAGASKSFHLIAQANYLFVLAGIVAEVLSLLAYGQLTQALLPVHKRPKYSTIMRIDLASLSVSHVLPGGTASGAGFALRLLNNCGIKTTDAGFVLATQGIGSAIVLNMILWMSLLVSIPFVGFNKLYLGVALLGILLIAIAGALILLFTKGRKHSIEAISHLANKIPFLRRFDVENAFNRVAERIVAIRDDPELLKRAIVWAALNWLLDATSLWLMIAAFGHFANPDYLLVAYGIANVMAVLPLTPSGLGIVEAFSTLLLVQFFSVPKGIAILGVISWRLFNFWVPIPVGVGSYVSLKISGGKNPEEVTMELDKIEFPPDIP